MFDWTRFAAGVFVDVDATQLYGSDGTAGGTAILTFWSDEGCGSSWQRVGQAVFVAEICERFNDSDIQATLGTPSTTFTLPGYSPSAGKFSLVAPSYAVVGARIVYAARNPAQGRELYVSDGTPAGSFLLKDIRPGHKSSKIKNLVSDGTLATFTATSNGYRIRHWVTDGTRRGPTGRTKRPRASPTLNGSLPLCPPLEDDQVLLIEETGPDLAHREIA